jgi:hypothetical protein
MAPTLLIMAAGSSSRYGGTPGGMKQTAEVGPAGEWLLEYTIYDAWKCGFAKVVLVVRRNTADIFRSRLKALESTISVDFAFQEMPPHRAKPWGTVDAVLSAKEKVSEPFLVLNADDYYGRNTLADLSRFLVSSCDETHYAMPGFEVRKTLSASGAVSRAECLIDQEGLLTSITERARISVREGKIVFESEEGFHEMNPSAIVSMNCWALHDTFMGHAKQYFDDFLIENKNHPTAECFLPTCIQHLIQRHVASVKVLPTDDQWFGMTYATDRELVAQKIADLTEHGVYPSPLW